MSDSHQQSAAQPTDSLSALLARGEASSLLAPLESLLSPQSLTLGPTPQVDRHRLAAYLGEFNRALSHPGAATLATKLSKPDTRVVVTGQQPGVFGGPFLTLVKAAATTLWARHIEATTGQEAVAVFWSATEDHDFLEIGRFNAPGRTRELEWSLGEDSTPLVPVGFRTLGSGTSAFLAQLRDEWASPRAQSILARVESLYRDDAVVGRAFAAFLVSALGEAAPLVLDASAPEVKQAQIPVLRQFLENKDDVEQALDLSNEEILKAGHPLQVRAQKGISPIFLHHQGQRRRIEWSGRDTHRIRGVDLDPRPNSLLMSQLLENPQSFSPSALARPVVQDSILGTSLQVLGPSELAYFAQASPLWPLLGVMPPRVVLRPRAQIVEPRQERQLEAMGLTVEDLSLGKEELQRRRSALMDLGFAQEARDRMEEIFLQLEGPSRELDPSLIKALTKAKNGSLGSLDRWIRRLERTLLEKDDVSTKRLAKLSMALAPDGEPQERRVSSLFFFCRYGDDLSTMLQEQLGLAPGAVHTLEPLKENP